MIDGSINSSKTNVHPRPPQENQYIHYYQFEKQLHHLKYINSNSIRECTPTTFEKDLENNHNRQLKAAPKKYFDFMPISVNFRQNNLVRDLVEIGKAELKPPHTIGSASFQELCLYTTVMIRANTSNSILKVGTILKVLKLSKENDEFVITHHCHFFRSRGLQNCFVKSKFQRCLVEHLSFVSITSN